MKFLRDNAIILPMTKNNPPALSRACVIIPNWNGQEDLRACLMALRKQSVAVDVIVVENGSIDGSYEMLTADFPEVEIVLNATNLGFAGGVNSGIRPALAKGYEFILLLNNDASPDPNWTKRLMEAADRCPDAGIISSLILSSDGKYIDTSGDQLTVWGLAYPRERNNPAPTKFESGYIFSACAGATLYRSSLFKKIGLFDEIFFAYYEDVDISFRAQLAGQKVWYEKSAVVYHGIGRTSGKIKGFTTYHSLKNIPLVLIKNMPAHLLWRVAPRFAVAYISFIFSAVQRGQTLYALKGVVMCTLRTPQEIIARHKIQKTKMASNSYIWSMLVHDLPPNAEKLRALRNRWHKLRGKQA